MRYTNSLDSFVFRLIRSATICIISTTFFLITYLHAEAAQIVVNAGCTLVNAISSANLNSAVGGCTAGSGADIIVLSDTTYTLSVANNTFGFGSE